jgi:hypothetical protein
MSPADIADYYLQLERRVARLERTSTVANSQSDTSFVGLLNVTGLTISSQTVVAYGTDFQVYLKFTWTAITLDSNVITDDPLRGYLTSWTKDGTNYTNELFTTSTDATIAPLAQGQNITFRVRAVTQKNTYGAYATVNVTTTLDNVSPGQPSTPTAVPYLGQVRIFWDGLAVGGGAMASDTVGTEIHMSISSITFTPTTATLIDVFYPGGGYYTVTGLTYGTTYYFRLVAVDKVGNRSVVSTGVSCVPVQAADGDIATVSIGKLIAGILIADMTVSARIKTANTGARVEMNSSGFQAFNSSNTQTVNISASTGNATITGAFQTGLTGQRIIIDSSGTYPTIYMYDSTTSNYAYINSPGSGIGVNSSSSVAGSGTYSRLFLNPTALSLEVVTYSAVVATGGRVFLNNGSGFLHAFDSSGVRRTEIQVGGGGDILAQSFYTDGTTVVGQIQMTGGATTITGTNGSSSALTTRITCNNNGDAKLEGISSNTVRTLIVAGQVDAANVTYNSGGAELGRVVAGQSDVVMQWKGASSVAQTRVVSDVSNSRLEGYVSGTLTSRITCTGTNTRMEHIGTGNGFEGVSTGVFIHGVVAFGGSPTAIGVDAGVVRFMSSSSKYKEDIQTADIDVEDFLKLRPVTFVAKADLDEKGVTIEEAHRHLGFIAEEVYERSLGPNMVSYTKGEVESVYSLGIEAAHQAVLRYLHEEVKTIKSHLGL